MKSRNLIRLQSTEKLMLIAAITETDLTLKWRDPNCLLDQIVVRVGSLRHKNNGLFEFSLAREAIARLGSAHAERCGSVAAGGAHSACDRTGIPPSTAPAMLNEAAARGERLKA